MKSLLKSNERGWQEKRSAVENTKKYRGDKEIYKDRKAEMDTANNEGRTAAAQ